MQVRRELWPLFPLWAMTSPFFTFVPTASSRGSSERWRKIAFIHGAPDGGDLQAVPVAGKNQFFRVMVPSKVAFTGVPTGVFEIHALVLPTVLQQRGDLLPAVQR